MPGLSVTDFLNALKTRCEAADPQALVLPYWLALEDGDNPDELRSSNDLHPTTNRPRVHAVMIARIAPGTRTYSVTNPPFDFVDEANEAPRRFDCEDTFKIGLFREYERTGDALSSGTKAALLYDAIADDLAKHRKLGLQSNYIINHKDLQQVRSYLHPFDQQYVHVEIGTIAIQHYRFL
jgi:hypothetical protein